MIKYKTKVLFMNRWIKEHPDLSARQVYLHWKGTAHGYRKQNMLATYRSVHNIPEPSSEKKTRSIPLKYRVKKPTLPPPPKELPERVRDEQYEAFYDAITTYVMPKHPKNYEDLRYWMYKTLNSRGYPSKKQSALAWYFMETGERIAPQKRRR